MQPDGLAGSAPGGAVGRRSVTRYGPGIAPSPSGDERFAFGPDHPISRSARTGEPVLVQSPAVPTPLWRTTDEQARWGLEIGVSSMLVAPVLSAGRTVAALLFVACGDRPRYTSDDLALVRELATRASTAVENAVTYQQTREVAVALQAAMLTEPPQHPGVEVVARYLPAAAGLTVGGDWYDAFPLPGGDLAVGVGDVAGHDLPAAAEMGQLRSMLRGLAHDSEAAPSVVLGRLDRVVSRLGVTRFTTLIYGRLSVAGGGAILRWSSAGHPAPVLVEPGCAPRLLTGETDVVLGVDPGGERHDNEVRLVAGSTLLLYTDGLVERRSDPDDRATTELLAMVAAGAGLPLADFCDHLVRRTAADTGDDIALLALRLPP